jgi:predicted dehydrogenase/glycine/D-amino acid oxidase-like deaminating enzyme
MTPRVVLVGVGRFGTHHLRCLKELEAEGLLTLAGVVVRRPEHRRAIERRFDVRGYAELDPDLLSSIDAVDIATPPDTHAALAAQCLRFVDVFLEKPLAEHSLDAKRLVAIARRCDRTLAVGHIFRHHPVTERLVELVARESGVPRDVRGVFSNPLAADQGREPSLELLHLYDVLDRLLGKTPRVVWSAWLGRRAITTSLRYGPRTDAHLVLGWQGEAKVRTLSLTYPSLSIVADFAAMDVVVRRNGAEEHHACPTREDLLKAELRAFAQSSSGRSTSIVSAQVGARIVTIAERAIPRKRKKPRVAVIGGGIFGTNAAIELASHSDVTLFERNPSLLAEASLVNCFRHHRGYHYPRSPETVSEIVDTRDSFEEAYRGAMVVTTPTYYAVPKVGSLVTADAFLAFCREHRLPFRKGRPPEDVFAHDQHALTVRVTEPSYHHGRLKRLIERRLEASGARVRLGAEVTRVTLLSDGTKKIDYVDGGVRRELTVDFVVNAMYANINLLSGWMNFAPRPVRVDVTEVLVVRLPIAPVSITVVDGPFACLMPTGDAHTFVLYHVLESIRDRYVPANGRLRKTRVEGTNGAAILAASTKLFPILDKGRIVESRVVCRAVPAHQEETDARPTELIEHGFGCWSVLSGKICSSVWMGKRISAAVQGVG